VAADLANSSASVIDYPFGFARGLCARWSEARVIFITGLREIFVILTDRLKNAGCSDNRLIRFFFELAASVWRPTACYDNFWRRRVVAAPHCGAPWLRRWPIHHPPDNNSIAQLRWWTSFSINLFASFEFGCFSRGCGSIASSACGMARITSSFKTRTPPRRSRSGQFFETGTPSCAL